MAKIIADTLAGELDVVLVHKLTHPEQPELAIGAIDEQGNAFVNDWAADLSPVYLAAEKMRQVAVLRQRRARYTPLRQPIDPQGRTVIVVDDGIATGSTMTAALRAIRARKPDRLIGVVAVASPEAARAMLPECDAMVCLNVSLDFCSVGRFFDDFAQVRDAEVVSILKQNGGKVSTVRQAGFPW
jgi:predicted phosphoribosyltransferase